MTQASSSAGTPPRRGVALPEDPSEEELARNWTLSEADRSQVLRCRGDDNRRRFAVQLCVLWQYGRFLKDYARVPVRILNHISRQIHLPSALSLTGAERKPPRQSTTSVSASISATTFSMPRLGT